MSASVRVGASQAAGRDIRDVLERARDSSLLSALAADDLAAALKVVRGVDVGSGQTLLPRGRAGLVLVLSGAAKEQRVEPHGCISIVALLGPGETTSLSVALDDDGATEVVTLQPTVALVWPPESVQLLVVQRPGVARPWLRLAGEQLSRAQRWAGMLARASARERVIDRLVELTLSWGRPEGDTVRVEVPLTQDELAAWAGTSRESTAKVLHDLREAGVVITRRRELVVTDLDGLAVRRARQGGVSVADLVRAALG